MRYTQPGTVKQVKDTDEYRSMTKRPVKDGISVKRIGRRRPAWVRVTATRGAVTTEAMFTEAEADELYRKLGEVLGVPIPGGQTGEQE